jgi:hypothetical protein
LQRIVYGEFHHPPNRDLRALLAIVFFGIGFSTSHQFASFAPSCPLTRQLLPLFKASSPSRIANVSSVG